DPTPIAPTAVRETQTINQDGGRFAAFETLTVTYSRATRQRVESRISATTEAPDAGEPGVRIERADRKVAWTLDAAQKRYVQCPLGGCPGA
ncbi:unnamed protein product, partial [Phaeothamnion confervicola]